MDKVQNPSVITYCKNHSDIPSRFFASEQPWIKYCQQCALNMALCGRNISQDFTTQEFERKMHIASIINQLKHHLKQADDNQAYYSKITNLLQQGAEPLTQRIQELTQSIQNLTKTRNMLQQLYSTEIGGKISQYSQRQSKMTLNSREIKAQLQQIESNFTMIISNQEQFEEYRDRLQILITSSKKELISEEQFNQGKEKVLDVMEIFYSEIEKLSTFSVGLTSSSKQGLKTDETFDMVLTPIDSNSLNSTVVLDSKGFRKNKRELKLRGNKRNQTQRDQCQKKKQSKRTSFCGIQNRNISCIYKMSK